MNRSMGTQMKTLHSMLAAALLTAGASAIVSQPAMAGYYWDPGCGCQRPVGYVQPYVQAPAVVYRPRVVYQPQVVYEAVPVAPVAYVHGCGCVPRGLFTGYVGHGFYGAGYAGYGGGYGYGAGYGYGPTD